MATLVSALILQLLLIEHQSRDYSSIIGGIEFDSGGGDKFKVGHVSATSPSGEINVVEAANLVLKTNNTEHCALIPAAMLELAKIPQ